MVKGLVETSPLLRIAKYKIGKEKNRIEEKELKKIAFFVYGVTYQKKKKKKKRKKNFIASTVKKFIDKKK